MNNCPEVDGESLLLDKRPVVIEHIPIAARLVF